LGNGWPIVKAGGAASPGEGKKEMKKDNRRICSLNFMVGNSVALKERNAIGF